MCLIFTKTLSTVIFGARRSALLLLLVVCPHPGEAAETDCSGALTGPAPVEDKKWVAFVGNLTREVSESDQEGKVWWTPLRIVVPSGGTIRWHAERQRDMHD